MEDFIKELEPPVAIESIPTPIPDIVEPPNNNLRDVGIVVGVVVLVARSKREPNIFVITK